MGPPPQNISQFHYLFSIEVRSGYLIPLLSLRKIRFPKEDMTS